jgi:hypothetical protein
LVSKEREETNEWDGSAWIVFTWRADILMWIQRNVHLWGISRQARERARVKQWKFSCSVPWVSFKGDETDVSNQSWSRCWHLSKGIIWR